MGKHILRVMGRLYVDLRFCCFGFKIGMMNSIVLPIFLPETLDFSHFDFGVIAVGRRYFVSDFFLKTVCLDKVLVLSDLIAVPQIFLMVLLHLI